MKSKKRIRLRDDQLLKEWSNCYPANIDVIIYGKADLEKYCAAEDWVLGNVDYNSVMRFGRTFYFKNKQDQIEFMLKWG